MDHDPLEKFRPLRGRRDRGHPGDRGGTTRMAGPAGRRDGFATAPVPPERALRPPAVVAVHSFAAASSFSRSASMFSKVVAGSGRQKR
jgi:hypothetical protein